MLSLGGAPSTGYVHVHLTWTKESRMRYLAVARMPNDAVFVPQD
jgi:hypothetical protein